MRLTPPTKVSAASKSQITAQREFKASHSTTTTGPKRTKKKHLEDRMTTMIVHQLHHPIPNPKLPHHHPNRRGSGPAPPPYRADQPPTPKPLPDPDSSEHDDDYGPPSPPPGSAAESALKAQLAAEAAQEEARQHAQQGSPASSKPQRAEWMLVPPSDSDWGSRVDPNPSSRRKARFASAKGGKSSSDGSISAIWTENAGKSEEVRRRGIRRKARLLLLLLHPEEVHQSARD